MKLKEVNESGKWQVSGEEERWLDRKEMVEKQKARQAREGGKVHQRVKGDYYGPNDATRILSTSISLSSSIVQLTIQLPTVWSPC